MNAPMLAELAELKKGARAAWAAGDYPEIARRQLWEIGPKVVARAGVGREDDVLDVACGTGNCALRAAQAGANVVALDLTPELLDVGRRLATEAGLQVQWVQGDAEDLPFGDESFDVVLSSFGVMFAPRHGVTAGELARVLRPGGRMILTSWTPEGSMGAFFRTVGSYLPPPPPLAQPPGLWGTEDHVAKLFDGTGVELHFDRDQLEPPDLGTTDEAMDYFTGKFGPLIMARQITEAQGRWQELRGELAAFYERGEPAEYLITTGRKKA
jgi:ubiquinone/menaquinone biosynthesis C-methylase UbiE